MRIILIISMMNLVSCFNSLLAQKTGNTCKAIETIMDQGFLSTATASILLQELEDGFIANRTELFEIWITNWPNNEDNFLVGLMFESEIIRIDSIGKLEETFPRKNEIELYYGGELLKIKGPLDLERIGKELLQESPDALLSSLKKSRLIGKKCFRSIKKKIRSGKAMTEYQVILSTRDFYENNSGSVLQCK